MKETFLAHWTKCHPRMLSSRISSRPIPAFAGMTALLLIAGSLLAGSAIAADLSPWAEANTKYQSADFKGAIESYEGILKSGKETAALDYNLGNAYFRLGQLGKSLLFYERALRIAPRNEDIRWNIDIIKGAVVDRNDRADDELIITWIKKVADSLTINESSLILSVLLLLFMAMTFIAFVFSVLRPALRGMNVLILFAFLAAAVLFGVKWMGAKDPRVVILDKQVEARYGPSNKETKAFTLHEGAEAAVTDQTQDWLYVEFDSKSSGWIPKKSCEII